MCCTLHAGSGACHDHRGSTPRNCGVVIRSKTKIKEWLTVGNYMEPTVQNRKTHTLGWKVVAGAHPSTQGRYTGAASEVDLPNRGPSELSEGEVNAVSIG